MSPEAPKDPTLPAGDHLISLSDAASALGWRLAKVERMTEAGELPCADRDGDTVIPLTVVEPGERLAKALLRANNEAVSRAIDQSTAADGKLSIWRRNRASRKAAKSLENARRRADEISAVTANRAAIQATIERREHERLAAAVFRPAKGPYSVVLSGIKERSNTERLLRERFQLSADAAHSLCIRVEHVAPEILAEEIALEDAVALKRDLERLRATVKIRDLPTHAPGQRKPIPERVRSEVWRRDEGRCVDCGSRENLEFDHIIPHSKGGADTVRNLELRCQDCNRRKGARI